MMHEMLVANAGSGKTFRLTVRTIKLLALGVSPTKIAALTFTRKAAGEFLEAVFLRLARCASDQTALAELRRDTGLEALDTEQCRAILLNLTMHLNRLCMGTIDGLFGRIARAFPLESGLPENFSILGASGGSDARLQVLATLFRENVGEDAPFREFLDLIRRVSRTQSERNVFQSLLKTVTDFHTKFLLTPIGHSWGKRNTIWPEGSVILAAGDHLPEADALWEAISTTHSDLAADAITFWEDHLDEVRNHVVGRRWSEPLKKFVKKLVEESEDEERGRYLPTGRRTKARVYLNDKVAPARDRLMLALLKPRLEELLRRSESLHVVMDAFESIYARTVRKLGSVTFDDITHALASHVEDLTWRTNVAYRLDTQFDHWLLDEFQDTSRAQWKVLGALVDEIVQDTDGDRSFFYVGDTKQAIYSWRGGDPKLFFEVRESYNRGKDGPIIATPALNISFRSDPEIIAFVNRVFGDLERYAKALDLPAKTVTDWKKAWVSHEVTSGNVQNRGYVRWVPVDKIKVGEEEEEEASNAEDQVILKILQETTPWKRGWSCAALKRSNVAVENLAALLQASEIPVAIEGKSNPCVDNPLGASLLAALRFAASPDDSLSGVLLASGSLGTALLAKGEYVFRDRIFREIASDGYAAAIQFMLGAVDLSNEPFLQARAVDFLTAAESFDQERQPADALGQFIQYLETYQRQEPENSDVVRIMTVHQAKGLTLDMTIISGMDGSAFSRDRTPGMLALGLNNRQEPWGLLFPPAEIARLDPVLSETRTAILAESSYGEICAAYVAVTRPRHGLYLVTGKLKPETNRKSFSRLLMMVLGATETFWEDGDPQWFTTRPLIPEAAGNVANAVQVLPEPIYSSAQPVSPSRLSKGVIFSEVSEPGSSSPHEAAGIGIEIHAFLAQIVWQDDRPPFPPTISPAARDQLANFLAGEPGRQIFKQPAPACWLWRERTFDLLLEDEWVSGVFDRVQIFLENGHPVAATVYDFKTDHATPAQLDERYARQMELYRKAAALLTGLPLDAVQTRIIPVR